MRRPILSALFVALMVTAGTSGSAQTMQVPETLPPSAARDAVEVGQPYIAGTYTDWTVRCVRLEDRSDVCELHQTLSDSSGNRTAEVNLFPLPAGASSNGVAVAAGGTLVAPLETLLTERIRLAVDGGEARIYPFSFCNRVGCVAQVGFTEAELDQFRGGRAATVSLVPVAAPDQRITLQLSLNGFTAAYAAVTQMENGQ